MKRIKRAESQAPLSLYPRPQMVRDVWISLDGEWMFSFDDSDVGESEEWFLRTEEEIEIAGGSEESKVIRVPYTYETEASGIGDRGIHPVVWYWKKVTVDGRFLLHFDGCDHNMKLWINGVYQGSHTGGYTRVTFDIGKYQTDDEINICVRVEDRMAESQVRGKQRWLPESYGCWYVQTTGIWKSVWLEPVNDAYVSKLKMTPDIHKKELILEADVVANTGKDYFMQCTVLYKGMLISRITVPVKEGKCTGVLPIYDTRAGEWGIALWTPGSPELYDLEVELVCDGKQVDKIRSYFGMREISIEGNNILLNGQPLYQKLVLDQGYWKKSGLTPCGDRDILADIEKIQAMGFNGLRKHQKTECERFLYWCDVKGLLVWAEGPSFYRFHESAATEFAKEWTEIVMENYNHPSVITWTPVNESWGVPDIKTDKRQQYFSQMIYCLTKMLDPMRPVIVNDGWEHTVSDIITLHDYEEDGNQLRKKYIHKMQEILDGSFFHNNYRSAFAKGFSYRGQPVIISEYGGAAFEEDDEKSWGYGEKVSDEEEFLKRFSELTLGIKSLSEICGYCYTQLTDVQQEKNGLLTEDRAYKVSPERIRDINAAPAGMFVNKKGY